MRETGAAEAQSRSAGTDIAILKRLGVTANAGTGNWSQRLSGRLDHETVALTRHRMRRVRPGRERAAHRGARARARGQRRMAQGRHCPSRRNFPRTPRSNSCCPACRRPRSTRVCARPSSSTVSVDKKATPCESMGVTAAVSGA